MDIKAYAEKHRLKIKDTGAEWVAPGKCGALAEIDGVFRARFLSAPRYTGMNGKLFNRFRAALGAGLPLKVRSGEAESVFYFDPNDGTQVKLAIRLVEARIRRKGVSRTAEQIAAFQAVAAAAGNTPAIAFRHVVATREGSDPTTQVVRGSEQLLARPHAPRSLLFLREYLNGL